MNALESALEMAVRRSFNTYYDITDNWLFHAPEHFLQNFILLELAKKGGFSVYAEATRKKIGAGMGRKPRGRPPRANTRVDLIIWYKSSEKIRAAVEIKRSWSMNETLRKDFISIGAAVKSSGTHSPETGYVIVYSEAKKIETLRSRFDSWADSTGFLLLNHSDVRLDDGSEADGWVAGFGIFRAP